MAGRRIWSAMPTQSFLTRSCSLGAVVCWALIVFEAPARSQGPQSAATRLEVQNGSRAEYRVREQLARLNFPNDAVGTTGSVTGSLVIRPDGSFAPESRLTVDLRTLRTDEPKRDGFVRENTLETNRYPLAEFVPRRQKGLTMPLPASGTANAQLTGDLTLHGVTAEQTWDVAATFAGDTMTAKATTRFNFAKYKITVPRIFGLLSVDDDIRLELNVRMRRF
jgi:polyisoprenoid-binding protein YceI